MITEAGGRTLVIGCGQKLKPTLAGIDTVLKLAPWKWTTTIPDRQIKKPQRGIIECIAHETKSQAHFYNINCTQIRIQILPQRWACSRCHEQGEGSFDQGSSRLPFFWRAGKYPTPNASHSTHLLATLEVSILFKKKNPVTVIGAIHFKQQPGCVGHSCSKQPTPCRP